MPMRISTRTSSIVPADRRPPSVVDGEVVRSRTRVPIFRNYVRPVLINDYDHRPDTLIQALVPAFALALPVAGVVIGLWVLLPVEAAVLSALVLAVSALRARNPEHTAGQTIKRLGSLVFLALLMYPAKTVVHCCCKLVR